LPLFSSVGSALALLLLSLAWPSVQNKARQRRRNRLRRVSWRWWRAAMAAWTGVLYGKGEREGREILRLSGGMNE